MDNSVMFYKKNKSDGKMLKMNVSEAYDIFRNMAYESGLRAGEDPHDYMCGFFKQAVSDDGLDCGSYIIYGAHIWWC